MPIHVVKPGDTLASVARQYGISIPRLIFDNGLLDPDSIVVGQTLLALVPEVVYIARAGDTFSGVARAYGVEPIELVRNNPYIMQQGGLRAGDAVVIRYSGEKLGDLAVNGYAYPFIDRELLRETLPYLTFLSVFSCGFSRDGTLYPCGDAELLSAAAEFGVRPILVLTPSDDKGVFNNELVTALVNDRAAEDVLAYSLATVLREKGYFGVDIDFEYIRREDRDGFTAFVSRLTAFLNAQGFECSVALAPKTSDEQPGLLYEGVDYAALGAAANRMLLMTYEWGYTYGPPMAVAPIGSVEAVVDYALTRIPSGKLDMGIPNYGYDWPVPFVRGETKATSISNPRAVELADESGTPIAFDSVSASPHFEYSSGGTGHVVWFDDMRSVDAKLRLAASKSLGGVGYWNLMRPFRPNWLLLNSLFNIS